MVELISWYIVELRSRLAPHLPIKQVETIVEEAKSHLTESVARISSDLQLSDSRAAAAAIDAFGSPEKVALSHLRQHARRPWGIPPIWLVLGGAAVSTICWLLQFLWNDGYFDNFGETWQNGLAGLIGLLALAFFAVGCYAGRRRYRRQVVGVVAGIAVIVPLLFSVLIVGSDTNGQGLSRLHLSRDVAAVSRNVQTLNRLDAYLQEGAVIFDKAKNAAEIPMKFSNPDAAVRSLVVGGSARSLQEDFTIYPWNAQMPYVTAAEAPVRPCIVPYEFLFAMVDGRIAMCLQSGLDFAHAKLLWRQRLPQARELVAQQRGQMQVLLAEADQASHGRLLFWNPKVFGQAIPTILLFLPVLVFVEATAFAVVRRRRYYPEFARA